MQLKFVKSHAQMVIELRQLWENYDIYKFLEGEDFIRKKELSICECIPNHKGERDMFIDLNRFDWLLEETDKKPR